MCMLDDAYLIHFAKRGEQYLFDKEVTMGLFPLFSRDFATTYASHIRTLFVSCPQPFQLD